MTDSWALAMSALRADPTLEGIFRLFESHGNAVAAEVTVNGKMITRTYSEYAHLCRSACGQIQTGEFFKPGEIVGLMYETCMDWPVLYWSILMAGGTPLLLNPGAPEGLNNRILAEARSKVCVAAAGARLSTARVIDAARLLEAGPEGTMNWADRTILCTSGTTGNSRIFLYEGSSFANQIVSFDEARRKNPDLPYSGDKPCKALAFLPFHHIFGFAVIFMLYSCAGKPLVYLSDKSVQTVLAACHAHKVTHVYCVPMLFNALAAGVKRMLPEGTDPTQLSEEMKARIREGLLGNQILYMVSGGGHIPTGTLQLMNLIGYPLVNGFGMTECGIITVELSADPVQRMRGGIGIPLSLTEYKVVPEGSESGNLMIRGKCLYSASMVDGEIIPRDKNEWFDTGDIVRLTPESLYIEGRSKDMIVNANGENIYPDEVEDLFATLPGISGMCILGIQNGPYEDIALLVKDAPEGFSEEVLLNYVKAANNKVDFSSRITRLYLSDEPLPLSASMKVKRQALKKGIQDGTWPCREISLHPTAPTYEPARQAEISAPKPAQEYENYPEVLAKVRSIVASALNVENSDFSDDAELMADLGGDSLTIYSAICALEDEFGIVIPDSEMRTFGSVSSAARAICAKISGKSIAAAEKPRTELNARRITDFSESEEYQHLIHRMESIIDPQDNPYFLPHDSLIRDTSVVRGNRVINLGSYNYLGMSGHPETMQAAIEAVQKYGTSASGSRTLAGEKSLYQQLERTIADWKHTEDAIVCTGGWATNLSFISCFMREGDFIVYDALSHNSIAEGVRLSRAESKAFPHNDLKTLEHVLQKIAGCYNKVLIVVEGVYSMDGDIAPIPEFVRLKKQYGCFLMVDEAHSGGVIGDFGGGVDDYFHLDPHDVDIKYGTMSKALGTCGGYIAADHSIVEYLRYSMNGFVFTAGIAPPLAAACMKAIEIIRRDNSQVKKLHENVAYFVRRAREEGMNICLAGESAIVPVLIGSDSDAARLSARLLERGVFVPPAMYPAVPMGESRMRFTISATHSIEQLEKAITELAALMREEGFLK